MKKSDLLIIIAVIILAGSFYLTNFLMNQKSDEMTVEVYAFDELVYSNVLNDKTEDVFIIDNETGYNKIIIDEGVVTMIEADCRDQICVLSRPISRPGEVIVCLPHQVIVQINSPSPDEGDIDAISN